MLQEPQHSLLLTPSGKHTVASCLEYGVFKVLKCHESATVCPIRGAIAKSKHETQSSPCHAGLALQSLLPTLRAVLTSFLCILELSEKSWMLYPLSDLEMVQRRKSQTLGLPSRALFQEIKKYPQILPCWGVGRVRNEERRKGTFLNSLSQY